MKKIFHNPNWYYFRLFFLHCVLHMHIQVFKPMRLDCTEFYILLFMLLISKKNWFQRQRNRKTEWENFHPLVHSLNAHNRQDWQRPVSGNSTQHRWFPTQVAGTWLLEPLLVTCQSLHEQELEPVLNPDTPIWDTGVWSGILTVGSRFPPSCF